MTLIFIIFAITVPTGILDFLVTLTIPQKKKLVVFFCFKSQVVSRFLVISIS